MIKLLAGAVSVVGVAMAILYGFVGIVAWADAQNVCPVGNQCGDARGVMWFSAIVVPVSSIVCVGALRILLRRT
jgi:hypothetical protein